ncbi:MAG: hypothetical protein KGD64_10460 [Candidatus Heimdallarchaeota archaeon]|nr:hypothetical protein [Candidatus Heimdallarchaeota archaeon]
MEKMKRYKQALSIIDNWLNYQMYTKEIHDGKEDSYIHVALFDNKIPEQIFKTMNIDTDKIIGVYGIEVESSVEMLNNFIQNNAGSVEICNLASLFVEEWLENNGYTPEIFIHIGCYG